METLSNLIDEVIKKVKSIIKKSCQLDQKVICDETKPMNNLRERNVIINEKKLHKNIIIGLTVVIFLLVISNFITLKLVSHSYVSEINNLSDKINILSNEITETNGVVNTLNENNTMLTEQNNNLTTELENKNKEIEELNKKISSLSAENNKLKKTSMSLPSRGTTTGAVKATSSDRELLAKIINAEASSKSTEDMLLVGNVVLNRVNHPKFPNSIRDVIYAPGQYSPTWNGSINKTPSEAAYAAADRLLSGERFCPENVVFQAQFKQGKGLWKQVGVHYYCYI